MMRLALALMLLMGPMLPHSVLAQDAVPEPAGFHGEPYKSPVPATLAGARVITTAQAVALHAQGVAFIDVMPRKKRPEGLPKETLWNAPPHLTIPGATWLYDTGYERLAPAEETRLQDGLAAATHDDKTTAVVMFCKIDCWMSWNAAKRAIALGYQGVIWYPEGADGWEFAGGTLEPATADGP